MNSLLDFALQEQLRREAPLADRMRPRTLEEFIGQDHILAPGRLLRRAIQADQLSSVIFYGPPGTGKTTLAQIIANTTKAEFIAINAVLSGVKEIRESIEKAETFRKEQQRRTILFVDEVHRFNKSQQDALLPHVEKGTIILIGATTENPYFEVNKALVSRSRIFQLKSLNLQDLLKVLQAALVDPERGFGKLSVEVAAEAAQHLADVANGDARALLNALELAVITSVPQQGKIRIDLATAEESIQQRAVLYDKDGDAHFDHISAFIKSVRGSDPDAALYWMAKMLYAGEDPRFLFRRMIILAAEDVGLADPKALEQVMACAQAYDYVGMPEGRFHLSQACLYLATAKKSNSNFAFFDALKAVEQEREREVPDHLKDANRDGKGFGHGQGYLYPHAYQDHWVDQQYLPSGLKGRLFYQPGGLGYEAQIQEEVATRREIQLATLLEEKHSKREEGWQERSLGSQGALLTHLRDWLLENLDLKPDQMILNLNAQSGVLLGPLLRKNWNLSLVAQVFSLEEREVLQSQYGSSPQAPLIHLEERAQPLQSIAQAGYRFERIAGRNFLFARPDKAEIFHQLAEVALPKGLLVLAESLPQQSQRFSEICLSTPWFRGLEQALLAAEAAIFTDASNPLVNWNAEALAQMAEAAGWQVDGALQQEHRLPRVLSPKQLEEWTRLDHPHKKTLAMYIQEIAGSEEALRFQTLAREKLSGMRWEWRSAWLLWKARRREKV